VSGPFGIATGSWADERLAWPAAFARVRAEGWRCVELTAAFDDELDALLAHLEAEPDALAGFDRVSLHAPVLPPDPAATLARLPAGFDAILHPNAYEDATALGARAVFENMDVQKPFGRTVADLASVVARHPEAGFCLDVAHVWTNDPSLALGHELLDAFGGRLRQLHISGIAPDGTHRPTTAADLRLYEPLLDRCRRVPWLLEAVLV
jgi:sugar phosphate isomerase/epimerase